MKKLTYKYNKAQKKQKITKKPNMFVAAIGSALVITLYLVIFA